MTCKMCFSSEAVCAHLHQKKYRYDIEYLDHSLVCFNLVSSLYNKEYIFYFVGQIKLMMLVAIVVQLLHFVRLFQCDILVNWAHQMHSIETLCNLATPSSANCDVICHVSRRGRPGSPRRRL